MKRVKRLVTILCAFALAAAAPFALSQPPGKPAVQTAAKRGITFDDLISLHRISEVQVSPDGKWAAYRVATPDLQANRSASNLWIVSTAGGPPQQLTRSGRDSRPQWSPDGKRLAFLSIRDTTPGADYNGPPVQRGYAKDIAFSPDSKEICFTAVTDKMEAISTNGDLFLVPVSGGAEPKRITTNPGFDGHPSYSPDGRTIAYRAQFRAGYEADKWRLMLYDRQTGKHTNVNEGFDRSIEGMVWTPDSKTIYFLAEDRGHKPVFSVAATPGAEPKVILKDTFNSDLTLSRDGRTLVFTQSSLTTPAEAFAANADGSGVRQLTRHNAEKLAALDLNPAEHFWFDGAEGTRVHAMLVRPPGFDPARKYPLVLIAHGGPQTQWSDTWGYRWNPEMFAAPGYAVLLINRRGSTGFGQKFTDEINVDYGGKPFVDLMKGVDYVLAKYPFVDGARMAAAGASYGGEVVRWVTKG